VPPTDPLPTPARPEPAAAAAAAALVKPRRSLFRTLIKTGAWAAMLLILVGIVASEGAGWVAAERFRRSLDSLDGRTLTETKASYDDIRSHSPLGTGLKMRVNQILRTRLVALADGVIEDYRREEPTMTTPEWREAQIALRWAMQLMPTDKRIAAKLATCDAHVIRLSARGQTAATAKVTYRRAIDRFKAAAALDDSSFDPYLGISRVAVYGLGDVDQAASAIQDAEKRGYVSGRRERALLGDGYLRRGNTSRALARTLSGDQRRRELERARADYQGCVDAFDPIVGFGYAAKSIERCKGALQAIDDELALTTERSEGF
jgi:hypothetical protein